jgi:hypothetical protein
VQAGFEDGVAGGIALLGVVIELADRRHLLGPLDRLGIVQDEVDGVALAIEPAELLHGDGPQNFRLAPVAAPEEFTVVGAVGVTAEEAVEPPDRGIDPHGHGHDQFPEVRPGGPAEGTALGMKKAEQDAGHRADGHHAVVLLTGCSFQHPYRHGTPLFCCPNRVHRENRSV